MAKVVELALWLAEISKRLMVCWEKILLFRNIKFDYFLLIMHNKNMGTRITSFLSNYSYRRIPDVASSGNMVRLSLLDRESCRSLFIKTELFRYSEEEENE